MTTTHTHNTDPANGPVCSHAVTSEMLSGWGFPVAQMDKVCGTPVVIREGEPFGSARWAAEVAGFVRTCTVIATPQPIFQQSAEGAAEALAWAESAVRRPVAA